MGAIVTVLDSLLLPRGLGQQPWRDARYRAVARAIDNSAFVFMVLNNILGPVALRKFAVAREQSSVVKHTVGVLYVAAGVAQQVASRRWPDRYYRCRHYFLLLSRLARMVALVQFTHWVRDWLQTAGGQPSPNAYLGAHSPIATPFVAAACLLALSGSMHTLMHVSAVPLPLLPQLFFQLLYFALLVGVQLEPAAASMELTPFMADVRAMCNGLNAVLAVLYSSGDGMQLPQPDEACKGHAAQAMVLFTQLYAVLVLPLYYAYGLEQECRQRMLQLAPGAGAAGRGAAGAMAQQHDLHNYVVWVALHNCVALLLVAMLCWVAALAALPFLPLVVRPLALLP